MGDLAQNTIRHLVQKFVPGTVAISPFCPNMRSIVINIDPHKLRDYNLAPKELIDSLAKGNTIIPAGNVYIIKKDTGSTLTVVADVRKSMQLFRDAVPKDVKVSFQFDESPTAVAAVKSVATEGLIGAGLTGLMILLFLRDLRSVIVVVATIPLALLGSLVGL
jgi:multidrug efflux pump subunit AcrB